MGCYTSKAAGASPAVPGKPPYQKPAQELHPALISPQVTPEGVQPAQELRSKDNAAETSSVEEQLEPVQEEGVIVDAAAAAPVESTEESTSRMEDLVYKARVSCLRQLQVGSVLEAEMVLMDAISSISSDVIAAVEVRRAALEELRATEEYCQTLAALHRYESSVARVLEKVDLSENVWKLAAAIPVDYTALGMVLTPEGDAAIKMEDRVMNIYWKKVGERAEVRMAVLVPTRLANINDTFSVLTAWVALNAETDLYNQWNPIISGKGPVELLPRGPYYNLWHTMVKIMFLRLVSLQEQRMVFNFEAGSHFINCDDLPEEHGWWKEHPPPSGFKLDPDNMSVSTVTLLQEHTGFMSSHIGIDFKSPPPTWLLKLLMEWVVPEICRRLLKSSIRCLKEDQPWYPMIQEDRMGSYDEARRLVEKAAIMQRERGDGSIYTPKNPPPPELVSGRSRSLTKFDAEDLDAVLNSCTSEASSCDVGVLPGDLNPGPRMKMSRPFKVRL